MPNEEKYAPELGSAQGNLGETHNHLRVTGRTYHLEPIFISGVCLYMFFTSLCYNIQSDFMNYYVISGLTQNLVNTPMCLLHGKQHDTSNMYTSTAWLLQANLEGRLHLYTACNSVCSPYHHSNSPSPVSLFPTDFF